MRTLLAACAVFLIAGAQAARAGVNVWTTHGPYGGVVEALAIDPKTPSTLYAGTDGRGVFQSTNSGTSWTAVNTGLTQLYVEALAINPTSPNKLYAGTNGGVFDIELTCVVGTGTSDGCTEAALDACLPGGAGFNGAVTFNCGASPATITVASTKAISADTTIDGGGLITISGGNSVGVFSVNSGVTFTVQNLTIANGNSSPAIGGGAISNGGTLNVTNSTFSGNSAQGVGGGAIFNTGTLIVTNSTFSGNSGGEGGAIANFATLNVTNSTFSGNSAFADSGAILNTGTLTVTNSTFSGNSAFGADVSLAGAIYNSGTLDVTNGTFSGNSATDLGGAIFNDRTLAVTNSTFSGNSALDGGGILSGTAMIVTLKPTATVTNSAFSSNSGGAIVNGLASPGLLSGATLTVTNSTFVSNAIDNTNCGNTARCQVTLTNTIVANSSGGNCAGTIIDGGHNLDDGESCGFSTANGSLSNSEPQLDPAGLGNNGGPTQTIALLAGSPAIDAGDPVVCADLPVNGLDQRGYMRLGPVTPTAPSAPTSTTRRGRPLQRQPPRPPQPRRRRQRSSRFRPQQSPQLRHRRQREA